MLHAILFQLFSTTLSFSGNIYLADLFPVIRIGAYTAAAGYHSAATGDCLRTGFDVSDSSMAAGEFKLPAFDGEGGTGWKQRLHHQNQKNRRVNLKIVNPNYNISIHKTVKLPISRFPIDDVMLGFGRD